MTAEILCCSKLEQNPDRPIILNHQPHSFGVRGGEAPVWELVCYICYGEKTRLPGSLLEKKQQPCCQGMLCPVWLTSLHSKKYSESCFATYWQKYFLRTKREQTVVNRTEELRAHDTRITSTTVLYLTLVLLRKRT